MVTIADFRTNFPEFANVTNYPDSEVQFWLNLAAKLLLAERWGDILDEGTQLFIAHNLALERAATVGGAVPGLNLGLVASKTIKDLSITYDTKAGIDAKDGQWGLTTFGRRFLWLANMVGMGGLQVGASPYGYAPPNYGFPFYGQ